jgi:hypothetical protein
VIKVTKEGGERLGLEWAREAAWKVTTGSNQSSEGKETMVEMRPDDMTKQID